jgi:8-oxo-dGTP pyrophosphatase MutT (NUDIX family)
MRTITRDIVAALIFSSDDKLLLGMTEVARGGAYSGYWVIPCGGIEEDETKLEALQREILEETTINIKPYEIELVDDTAKGESEKTLKNTGERALVKMNFFDYEIHIPKLSSEVGAKPTEELVRLEWVALKDLSHTKLSPPTTKLLKKLGHING